MAAQAEPVLNVRPTSKFVLLAYAVIAVFLGAGLAAVVLLELPQQFLIALVIVDGIFCTWAVARHVQLMSTRLTVEADRLRYEEGVFSKTTRSLNLSKIQDVRVDQSFAQRIVGIGSLGLETAGESGRLTMPNIDQPQRVADQILELSRRLRNR